MAKKRGVVSKIELENLIGSIKEEQQIVANLAQTNIVADNLNNKQLSDKSDGIATPAELNLIHIALEKLQRGKYQPRIDMGEETLQELALSIKQHGVMQPITIRPVAKIANDSPVTHEIIAGERRWRAAKIAGLSHIPAVIRPLSDDVAIALALIENIQREDLTIMEQAVALQRFHDEFGMTHEEIAKSVGKARTSISNMLRLNQLHDDVKTALNQRQLDMGHARALLGLSIEQQPIIAKKVIKERLTVRKTEQLVNELLDPEKHKKTNKGVDIERMRINQELSENLGAMVKIKQSSNHQGSIEIFFHDNDEFQTLIQRLMNNSDS